MKKISFIISCLLVSQFLMASINRNIFGLTLGKTTKEEVNNVLISKGLTIGGTSWSNMSNVESAIEAFGTILFGGLKWDRITVIFNDGVVSSVTFSNTFTGSGENLVQVISLIKNLGDKYEQYADMDLSSTKETNDGGILTHIVLIDQYTQILLDSYIHVNNNSKTMLQYIDMSRTKNDINESLDEL